MHRSVLAGLVVMNVSAAIACSYGPEVRGPFRGQVVDIETGKPLEGAVVVASWEYGNPFLRLDLSVYDAQEAVTDANGRFELPGLQSVIWWHNVHPAVFYVYAAGYRLEETRVLPPNGREHLDPTVHYMRRLTTRAELCDPARPRMSSLVPQRKTPRYIEIRSRERANLRCGFLDQERQP